MNLHDDLLSIKGIGESNFKLFNRLGLFNLDDLIYHYPRRYDDYSNVSSISKIRPGPVTIKVQIISVVSRYSRRGLHITEALVKDESGSLKITWFNQPYREQALKQNVNYFVSGLYDFQNRTYGITNPAVELESSFTKNTARIVPIYSETKGLKSYQIRKAISQILPLIRGLPETIPKQIIRSEKLFSHARAIEQLHFPNSVADLEKAKKRIGFEELYEITLAGLLNKKEIENNLGIKIPFDKQLAKDFVKSLDFKLTDAQRKSAWQILQDIDSIRPMNRMLEGDVGSGKTVVALMAMLMNGKLGYQAAYMAPTEILAYQQFSTISNLLSPFKISVELYVGAMKKSFKNQVAKQIEQGTVKVVVGTHALIQKHPKFKDLTLVVIDEQHRFGVGQREKLLDKAKYVPHVLTMTATPIPRSLALIVYGELDISIINQLPVGRKPIITKIIQPASRISLYKQVEDILSTGKQAYVVCPLIDESDVLGVKSVNQEFKLLNDGPFKHRSIGLMHGQLKSEEKSKIMKKFTDGELDILVSTTVIEVGVNVPNATIMIIEGAERFGLAQLHQIRGRVRRSSDQAYCFVIPSLGGVIPTRLRYLESIDDGFKLAEKDLELRGPGEIYGTRQSGVLDLRIAKLTDKKLIASARNSAKNTIELNIDLLQYPRLSARLNKIRKITNLN